MSARIVYKDLLAPDAIRLFLLQPRSESTSDEIHCKLFYTSLSELEEDLTLQYTALSYVWGDEREQREIAVDGVSHHITLNLFNALRSLRHEVRELPLWVDAVCINQQNIPERNQQVSFMGAIYAAARNTIIYLGESDTESDWIIQSLRNAGSIEEADATALRKRITSSILSRPWFGRVWVLQELALSHNPIIQCGSSRVKWSALSSFMIQLHGVSKKRAALPSSKDRPYGMPTTHGGNNKFNSRDVELPELERIMLDMQNIRVAAQSENSNVFRDEDALLDVVQKRRGLGAKDPRDIIFAHTGMLSYFKDQGGPNASRYQSLLKKCTINYAKPVVDVYNEFAQTIIEGKGDLSISIHAQETFPQETLPGLASWAPDVRVPRSNHFQLQDSYMRIESAFSRRSIMSEVTC